MLQERRRRLLLQRHKWPKRTEFSSHGILSRWISDTENWEAGGKCLYLNLLEIFFRRKEKSGGQMLPARTLVLASFLTRWLMTTYKVRCWRHSAKITSHGFETLQLLTTTEVNTLPTRVSSPDGRLATLSEVEGWYFHPGASSRSCWVRRSEQKGNICWHWKRGKMLQVAKILPFLQVSIAVSATVTNPTEDVKEMSPERRKCLLESETSNSLYQVHL